MLVVALHYFAPISVPMPPLHMAAGSFLITVGIVMTLVAIFTFSRHHTPVLPFRQPETLLCHGVFRWSRNPIYLGETFILAGIALRVGELLPWLVVLLFIVGLNRGPIAWEERALREKFGADFDRYCHRTRRWL